MKKLLFTCVFLLSALCLSAQSISYANMMRFAKQTSISGFGQVARSLGYKLIHTQTDSEFSYINYGWGNCYYDEYQDDIIVYKNKPWAYITITIPKDASKGCITWHFPNLNTYNTVKSQVKANGWYFSKDWVSNDGVGTFYEKQNTMSFISLYERNVGSYAFNFCQN